MNNKKTLGNIFDTIKFDSSQQLNSLIDTMDDAQINFLTIKALESAFNRGAFTLVESEIVSKIIRNIGYTVVVENFEQ